MIIYLARGIDIAAAESEATAARLIADGYTVIIRARYIQLWRYHDEKRRHELVMEELRTMGRTSMARQTRSSFAPWRIFPTDGRE